MNTSEEDCIELEARGIPRTKVHWPDDLDRTESIIMNLPPRLRSGITRDEERRSHHLRGIQEGIQGMARAHHPNEWFQHGLYQTF